MGKSKTIERLLEENEDFRVWLAARESELHAQSAELTAGLEAMAADYYRTNTFTRQQVLSGSRSDFRYMESWSPELLRDAFQAVSAGIFSENTGTGPLLNGRPLPSMKDLELYATGKALEAVSGISSAEQGNEKTTGTAHIALGYGFHLFLGISRRSFYPAALPGNREIDAALFCFDVSFSEEEYLLYPQIGFQKLYTEALATAGKYTTRLLDDFGRDRITTDEFEKRSVFWEKLMSDYRRKLEELNRKHQKLLKEYSSL